MRAARALRYMDRFVTVTQGEVFYVTQVLAELEGLQRGPAGNTSLAAAFAIARELDQDQILVVQETEYTGAGKHPLAQLNLAKQLGIVISRGDPKDNQPGWRIVIPQHLSQISVTDIQLDSLRQSYIRHALEHVPDGASLSAVDLQFLAEETQTDLGFVEETIHEFHRTSG